MEKMNCEKVIVRFIFASVACYVRAPVVAEEANMYNVTVSFGTF